MDDQEPLLDKANEWARIVFQVQHLYSLRVAMRALDASVCNVCMQCMFMLDYINHHSKVSANKNGA